MMQMEKILTALLMSSLLLGSSHSGAEDMPSAEAQRKPLPVAHIDRKTPVDFEREILPILRKNCLACHNKTTTKAGLILESPGDMLKGGDSGKVVVPNHSGDSLLLKLASHQETPMMPPKNNKVEASDLAPEELGLLKLWIDQGAKGEVHDGGAIAWQPLPAGLNPIYSVALSPDGQFAACGRANQIFIYHVPSGRLVTRLTDPQLLQPGTSPRPGVAHRDLVNSLAFSPDGNILASGGYREIKLWRRPRDVQKFAITLGPHQAVLALAVSPDGKWLATGDDGGGIRLWNMAAGKSFKRLSGHKGAVNSLLFSPDNRRLASASADKTIRVWDVVRGKPLLQAQTTAEVNAVVWIAGGDQILSGGADELVRLWFVDTARGELRALREFRGHEGPVTSLASLPPCDAQFISGSGDGTLRLWDAREGRMLRQMEHGGPVTSVAVRSDGKRFASAGLDKTAKLWDAKDGKEIAKMSGDHYLLERLAEKERGLTLSNNELVYRKKVWQTATNEHKAQLERVQKATEALAAAEKIYHEKQTKVTEAAAAKTAGDNELANFAEIKKAAEAYETADKTATQAMAKVKTAKENPTPDPAATATLSEEAENKSKLAAQAKADLDKFPGDVREKFKQANNKFNDATKVLSNAEAELKKAGLPKSTAETELQLATKAVETTKAAMLTAGAEIEKAEDSKRRADTEQKTAGNAAHDSLKPIRSIAFSPDNLTVATAGDDEMVHTWSAESGMGLESFKGHKGPVFAAVFAGSGVLVSGASDRSAVAWDLGADWALQRTIGAADADSLIADRVNALRFSPDGKRLASGGGEPTRGGEIKIWQVADGKMQQAFTHVHSDEVFGVDFSADGNLLASGAADKFMKVLDLATGKVLKTFEGHNHHVLGVSWNQDGRTLASAGADDVIKVWDFVTGERKKTIEGFGKEVTSIGFVGITDQALVSSGDHQICLVNVNGDKVRSFEGGTDFMNAAAATSDGKIVIGAGQDGVLLVWNGTNGKVMASFAPPKN